MKYKLPILALLFSFLMRADFSLSVRVGPPALPVYAQPVCPGDGYLWNPGYWAYENAGYFWIPGVWVRPPRPGVLWTPGYWGFAGGVYNWHPGYWGPRVGFYGGVHYGFGYNGSGFVGGTWSGAVFRYNTAVTNINTKIVRNVYVNRTVINNTTVVNRASFNGPGGVRVHANREELAATREQHLQATQSQTAHQQAAFRDRSVVAHRADHHTKREVHAERANRLEQR